MLLHRDLLLLVLCCCFGGGNNHLVFFGSKDHGLYRADCVIVHRSCCCRCIVPSHGFVHKLAKELRALLLVAPRFWVVDRVVEEDGPRHGHVPAIPIRTGRWLRGQYDVQQLEEFPQVDQGVVVPCRFAVLIANRSEPLLLLRLLRRRSRCCSCLLEWRPQTVVVIAAVAGLSLLRVGDHPTIGVGSCGRRGRRSTTRGCESRCSLDQILPSLLQLDTELRTPRVVLVFIVEIEALVGCDVQNFRCESFRHGAL
mmetsp:Transcript_16493/g.33927  ORF Transcript_16493/g.33927 Transcript_16493/m.33927 type:complete len:254 (-) Transcript_16493:144-905(-)